MRCMDIEWCCSVQGDVADVIQHSYVLPRQLGNRVYKCIVLCLHTKTRGRKYYMFLLVRFGEKGGGER